MRLLIVADIHGDVAAVDRLVDAAGPVDAVIAPGNITDLFRFPPEFSQLDIADLVIQKLLLFKKPLLCLPGNHDPFEIVDLFREYGVNLHGTVRTVAGMPFVGFGGAQTPFNTQFEPTDEEIAQALAALAPKAGPGHVLVTHNPPIGTKLDQLQSGEHVGSQAIRDYILKHKPLLSVSAHIHEGRGEETVGSTVCFNPGPLFHGWYGLVTVNGNIIRTESRRLPTDKPEPQQMKKELV